MGITVIGKGSFLAQAVAGKAPESWQFISHEAALTGDGWKETTSTVVNFAFPPDGGSAGYRPDQDIDSKLAGKIRETGAHYIMLSSRLVYGRRPDGFNLSETAPCAPDSPYGGAKQKTELALQGILPPDRLTILRLSNVFGYEPGRQTFFGQAMGALKNQNEISFDISPFAVRDFLPVGIFADMIITIAENPTGGTYNLGAGFGIASGLVAEGLIEGYGSGSLKINNFSRADQFWLNTEKLRQRWALAKVTEDALYEQLVTLGHQLKTASL